MHKYKPTISQRIPFVREWGSWAVFIYSCSMGLVAGLLTHPWQAGSGFSIKTLVTILGLVFLLNSKAPLTSLFYKHFSHIITAALREYSICFPDEGRETKGHGKYRADKRGGLSGTYRIFLGMIFLYHGHKSH